MPEIIVIGGGPAGVSAALTARNRGKSVGIIYNGLEDIPLYKSEAVDNYPGFHHVSGKTLLISLHEHAKAAGVEKIIGRALSVMPIKKGFGVSVGSDFYDCLAVILTAGVSQKSAYPGERELLGRGVSYCATCDGMLYRGKRVAVLALSSEAEHEAEFLRGIGCEVLYFEGKGKYEIKGENKVRSIIVNGEEHEVGAVFILRSSVAMDSLIPGISMKNGHIIVDEKMSTNIPGVFAAGDCTGKPYQIAKAAGQGNIAGLSAAEFITYASGTRAEGEV